jgi:hypothetical protein
MDPCYTQRESISKAMIRPPDGVQPRVFLGDSRTAGCEWRELFGNRPCSSLTGASAAIPARES